MIELSPENTPQWLRDRNLLPRNSTPQVEALAWGVSNVVLRVTFDSHSALVVKQSRGRLRTPDPWFSRLDRIWREVDVMRVLEPVLPRGVVPRVLYEDREDYAFVMEAAPADHVVWKQQLLDGVAETRVSRFLGSCLGTIHRETAFRPDLQSRLGDVEVFVQLRVDPFYRKVAGACPEIAPAIDRMIETMFSSPACIVHADFSPKNVLIAKERIILVDYETGHYGDPAFDLGFFLSHLLLKAVRFRRRFPEYAALTTTFWETYRESVAALSTKSPFLPSELVPRMAPHLAGCMRARIDGTSRVDYMNDPREQQAVRDFCRHLFTDPPRAWPEVVDRLFDRLVTARLVEEGTS
jgi:5-methylthioribose kinase